jgi:transposase
MLINNARGWLRTQLIRLGTGATATFPQRLRTHAEANKVQLPDHVVRLLEVIDVLNLQVKEADKQLTRIAGEDPVCRRLMTTPGVGPVTAVRFVAAIDDVKRFKNAHAVQSYLGLTRARTRARNAIRSSASRRPARASFVERSFRELGW